MKIYIPSHKRAGKVITHDYLPDSFICVNEDEVEDYAQFYDREKIIAMPMSVRGNMGKVRNWMLTHCDDEHLIMLDDDVKYMGHMRADGSDRALTAEEAMELFEQGFILAEDLGVKLWGVNLQADPMFYREYTPFSTQSPVLGPFGGHILRDNPLRYDENIGLKEDYDFYLQHIQRFHKVLRMNMYHYMAGHIVGEGGCIAHRTMEKEVKQLQYLLKKWGSSVVQYDLSRSLNPIVRSPYSGV
jgi:hypothetical protein